MQEGILSAPTVVNLEITDVCNAKCRHCYNFWREKNAKAATLSKERLDRLIDIFVEAGVFHVILSGGEPFSIFELLEYGFRKLLCNNISISCNSNLMLATEDKLRKLRDIGLDHILTSLNSHDPGTNDYMVNYPGAFKKIIKGIEGAVKSGIRVSVNMIVSQLNKDHVYNTGKLASELGCQKIFGTRVVPSVHSADPRVTDFHLTKDDALCTLDQLVRVKEETGIMVGTLVSYPLCLLGDLERYRDFVGRGCPAQSGHVMGINASGETHACVHQEEGYGNIFEIGIFKAYENMRPWHNQSYRYKGCEGCDYIEICHTGCRMSAHGYFGKNDERDNLMINKENFTKPYNIVYDNNIYNKIDQGLMFTVPERIRFRRENGFYLLNIRWANTITCPTDLAETLQKSQRSGKPFSLKDIGSNNREILAKLYFKDAIECNDLSYNDLRNMAGLSANI
jgi:radical SAM protein with 4Fe4S-binding SPASM domain